MALPPERITVKRRRDEDPVEALYIQSKKQRPAIFWKLQGRPDDHHQFIQELSPEATRKKSTIPMSDVTTPSILSQSPERGKRPTDEEQSFAGSERPSIRIHATTASDAPLSNRTESPNVSIFRKYHLTSQSYPTLKRQASFSGGVQKRQRPQRDRLAIFVESERAQELIERAIHERQETNPHKVQKDRQTQDQKTQVGEGDTLRKRPNVNAAEKAWRSETWDKQNVVSRKIEPESTSKPATSWDVHSMNIAQELQNFALDQAGAGTEAPQKIKSKFQPKPPGPRHAAETTSIAAAHGNLDNDGDYIFDTYVRTQMQTPDVHMRSEAYVDPLDRMDSSKVGVIVIEEDQETLWEEFGDEDQSEVDFETDEEDENAEDFYGNDYPEDEVDSDDEYGRETYKYRKYASDDEEYADDEPTWSDAEHESVH